MGVANLGLMLFNLLPIFPMDGGRVLRALLSMGMGPLRATEIAAKIALGLAVLLALAAPFVNMMLLVVAGFVVFAGQYELFVMRQRARAGMPSPLQGPVALVAEHEPSRRKAPGSIPATARASRVFPGSRGIGSITSG